jgi:hypothetical protein
MVGIFLQYSEVDSHVKPLEQPNNNVQLLINSAFSLNVRLVALKICGVLISTSSLEDRMTQVDGEFSKILFAMFRASVVEILAWPLPGKNSNKILFLYSLILFCEKKTLYIYFFHCQSRKLWTQRWIDGKGICVKNHFPILPLYFKKFRFIRLQYK